MGTTTANDTIESLFEAVDADGSGELDGEEAKVFLRLCGCPDEQLDFYWKDLLATADTDGDGEISKPEFVQYILKDEDDLVFRFDGLV